MIKTIDECFSLIQNGANIKQGDVDGGFPITRIETITNDKFSRDRMGYAGITDISKYTSYLLEDGDLLMSHIHGMNLLRLKARRDVINPAYAKYCFYGHPFRSQIRKITKKSVNQASFAVKDLKQIKLNIPALSEQNEIVMILDKIQQVLAHRIDELSKLDDLIKARFVELFGDLKTNSKGWQIVGFKDCADIDTNMVHDFEGYEDYPHIGIDSIEKETGRLIGYRTIAEDGIISGKYLFTPEHIIYSKIRPNLNKVAMPDFDGLCSADAYPILVKEGICNREYFGYTLRSQYFLDYILAFSNRTNLPKVNKSQVEGFVLPLPPIEVQEQFAAFVAQTDKSKVKVQKALDETQKLFDSLMQQYFG